MKKPEYYKDIVKEIKENSVIIEKEIFFEKGKTTPKGEYIKLNQDNNCCYPERACCNYGEFFERCPYMKCLSLGNWICIFKTKGKIKGKINTPF